jgi:protein involved in polysaccharide export with SLBB domain
VDAIHLRFFGDSIGSGDFRVDEHGMVVLPVIGTRDAIHQDPDSLKAEVVRSYRRTFRYAPEATVLRRITVLGAVARPGLYMADATMNPADVIAMAGGALAQGRANDVQIFRNGNAFLAPTTTAQGTLPVQLHSGDQLYVPEASQRAKNAALWLSAIGTITAIVALIVR